MKRYLAAVAAVALAAMPLVAGAAQFRTGDEYTSAPAERISGGLYVAAGSVTISSPVDGDVWAAGGDVVLTGPIAGDVAVGGGTVQLLSAIQGDVRAAGGKVSLNGRIGGDLVVTGGSVHILADGVVDGGLYVMGGTVTIDGTVRGPVEMMGGRLAIQGAVLGSVNARLDDSLVVGPGAQIGGTLTYRAPKEASISPTARVGGAVDYSAPMQAHQNKKAGALVFFAIVGALTAMRTLALLGLALLLVWRWRRPVLEVLQDARDRFWPSLGRGAVYAIFVPLAGILLLVSVVGTLAGGLLLALYGGLMVLAKVMAGLFLGAVLWKKLHKGSVLHLEWAPAIVGVLLLELIGLVPVVGWLVQVALCLAVFGALANRTQRMLS